MGVKADKIFESMDTLIGISIYNTGFPPPVIHLTGEQLDLIAEYSPEADAKVRPKVYRGVRLEESQ